MILEPCLPDAQVHPQLRMPSGLIGLPDFKSFDLLTVPGSEPFIIMCATEPEPIEFVIIEPGGVVPDYIIEISNEDAAEIGISSNTDNPLVFVIVTIKSMTPQKVTANLMAPILVNRKTGEAKQVVLANYTKYSTTYPLIDSEA